MTCSHASLFCVIMICHGGNGGMGFFSFPFKFRFNGIPLRWVCLPGGAVFLFTVGGKKM